MLALHYRLQPTVTKQKAQTADTTENQLENM